MQRQQHALRLGVFDLLREELGESASAQHRCAKDIAFSHRDAILEDGDLTARINQLDPERAAFLDDGGLLVGVEVARRHAGDV